MAGKNVVTLSDSSFDAEVLKSDVPVMVDFWAEWCGPCKMLGPTIDQLADDFAGQLINRDRKSTRLNSSHLKLSRMPSSA